MPLRGFLYAFWTLVAVVLLVLGVVCCIGLSYALPWILSMVERHPLVMDAMNYAAPGFVLWGCE